MIGERKKKVFPWWTNRRLHVAAAANTEGLLIGSKYKLEELWQQADRRKH